MELSAALYSISIFPFCFASYTTNKWIYGLAIYPHTRIKRLTKAKKIYIYISLNSFPLALSLPKGRVTNRSSLNTRNNMEKLPLDSGFGFLFFPVIFFSVDVLNIPLLVMPIYGPWATSRLGNNSIAMTEMYT